MDHLTKRYGQKLALSDFSYTFHEGIYGILGANGAGISTMKNLITDNVHRDGGSITYCGTDILILGVAFLNELVTIPCYKAWNGQGYSRALSPRTI